MPLWIVCIAIWQGWVELWLETLSGKSPKSMHATPSAPSPPNIYAEIVLSYLADDGHEGIAPRSTAGPVQSAKRESRSRHGMTGAGRSAGTSMPKQFG
jgi:hypothetical protein